jgi:hypothetical protein
MEDGRSIQLAEAIPFSRANAARVIGIPISRLNNWIDRNRIWQTDRGIHFHRSYTISEIFDLAGFAQMRLVGIPEKQCASFVYNFGFYREFLHGEQIARFSMSDGEWQLGVFNPNAVLTLAINMRELAISIFDGVAKDMAIRPSDWPNEAFEAFRALYRKAVALDRLPSNVIAAFEGGDVR